jgi:hypothetical protein
MRIILAALALIILIAPASAQYLSGPRIDPNTGYRYYHPYDYGPGRQYFVPPQSWYREPQRYNRYQPYYGPTGGYLPRVNCWRNAWGCPGPP